MGKLSAYNIAFKGLTPEKHEFDYKIDGRFFELFENSFVDTSDIKVRVILDKENPVYTMKLELNGFV